MKTKTENRIKRKYNRGHIKKKVGWVSKEQVIETYHKID